jgi:hypothetical protein
VALPLTWTEAVVRLSELLSGRDEAEEWLREAVAAVYGVESLHDLSRADRAVAFRRTAGAVDALEELGVPLEYLGPSGLLLLDPPGTVWLAEDGYSRRERIVGVLARYFDGAALHGPPWRLSPYETGRPSREEWATADFE